MITARKLDNGIRVIMERIPAVRSMAIGFWVKTGAVNETESNAGISHFVEHMMFKGTPSRDARTIAWDIDKIGGQMNAFTGKEATCYYVKTISDNYKDAAKVLVDMIENSLFDNTEMDRERKVICEEIKMSQDAPDDVAHDTLIENIFKGRPLGNSVIGTADTISGIDHDVMSDYVKKQYVRDSLVISVAGNFDEDDVCNFFEKSFNCLEETKEVPEDILSMEGSPEYSSKKKDIMQSHICMGVPCVAMGSPEIYPLQILNNLFGGGMSSRLFQNVREQKGLAYSVYSMFSTFKGGGYFEIYAGVGHDSIEKAIGGIKEELDILADKQVTEEELESSKQQLLSSYAFSQESTSARMIVNGKNYLLLNKIFDPEEVLSSYKKVTIEDIDRVKKMVTDFSSYYVSLVSDEVKDIDGIIKGIIS